MANTTIKITQLPSIGNNLTAGTVLPVVAVNGITPVTDKTTVGNIANFTLTNAGNTLPPALLSIYSQTVTNAAQPNITSVGTLSVNTLKISGGVNGYFLQTDGTGNLAWSDAGGGGGNGVPGGANTQVQFNDAGNFGGNSGFTFNKTTGVLAVPGNVTTTGNITGANLVTGGVLSVTGNANIGNIGTAGVLTATGNVRGGNINTDGIVSAVGNIISGNVNTGTVTLLNGAVLKDTSGEGVAFGQGAGGNPQGTAAVAVGLNAGNYQQGNSAIALGNGAGGFTQGTGAVASGWNAGNYLQGNLAVAVGNNAGYTGQGTSAVAIGANSGVTNQGNNSIIINATGSTLNQTTANTFTVAPIRNDNSNITNALYYNTTTKEVTYGSAGSLSIVPNDVTYGTGSLYGNTNPGFTVVSGQDDDDTAYNIPLDFPLEFLGNSYSNGNVFLVSNSYLTFGPTDYTDYNPVGPVVIPAPAIYVGARDLSNQKYYYGYADGTDIYVIGYEGSIETSGTTDYPGIKWELQVSAATPDQIKIVVDGPNDGYSLNFPAGIWGISDGAEWVDQYQPLPWFSNNNDDTYNSIIIAPVTPVTASTIAFTGPGVTYSENGGTTFININPFDDLINVGEGPGGATIGSTYYDLTLTTAGGGDDLNLYPLGGVNIRAGSASDNQPGSGYRVQVYGGNAHDDPTNTGQNYDGGNVDISGGGAVNSGVPGLVNISSNGKYWTFNGAGGTIYPTLNVQRGDNPSGTISGQTLLFGDRNQEAIISTPDGVSGNEYSQRLVINPGQGYNYGEGGDIYLWAGRGGDGSGSGGDIKIRGGQGGANTTGGNGGDGGYIRIEAGDTATTGGYPGYVTVVGGNSATIQGGYVEILGGRGATFGGTANLKGGYGTATGGNVNIWGGGTGNGQSNEGNVNIQTGGNTWTFDPSGNLTLPAGGIVHETGIPSGGLTGNTIALKPSGGTNADQQLLVYPTTGNDNNHLHLTSGNLFNTELFLGDDNFFVKLANTGNIVINTNDNAGNIYQWTFNPYGVILTNDNLFLQTPSGVPATVTAITGSSGSWESNPSSDLATTGGTGNGLRVNVAQSGGYAGTITIATPGSGYTDGDAITVVSGSSSASFTISVINNEWTFDTAGNFVVAGNISYEGVASPAPSINGFDSASFVTKVTTGNIFLNGGHINGGIPTVVTDGINSIALALGAQMDVYEFPFSQPTRGQLTISGVTTPAEVNGTWYYQSVSTNAYQIYTDSTYSTLVDATGWSAYTGGGAVAITKQVPAANIVLNTNGYLTTFANDGNIAFPTGAAIANISGFGPGLSTFIGDAQGVTLGTAPGNDITFTPADGVALYSNGAMWTFGIDGNLTTPGDSAGDITGANLISAITYQSSVVAFSALPSATTAGLRAFVNNANLVSSGNFGAAISGGGSNTVPVYSDGSVWRIG